MVYSDTKQLSTHKSKVQDISENAEKHNIDYWPVFLSSDPISIDGCLQLNANRFQGLTNQETLVNYKPHINYLYIKYIKYIADAMSKGTYNIPKEFLNITAMEPSPSFCTKIKKPCNRLDHKVCRIAEAGFEPTTFGVYKKIHKTQHTFIKCVFIIFFEFRVPYFLMSYRTTVGKMWENNNHPPYNPALSFNTSIRSKS